MSLAESLKQKTADAHRSAESRDLQRQLVRGELDERTLARYLVQLRGIHAELERLFDAHLEQAQWIGWSDDQHHSRRLDADLVAMGLEPSRRTPSADRLLQLVGSSVSREPAALLGFFYVLEGSMNGNRFIARALRQSPAAARCEFTYFDPYGDAQPARWAGFRTALDAAGLDADRQRVVIDAALAMFDGIGEISDEVLAAEGAVAAAAPH